MSEDWVWTDELVDEYSIKKAMAAVSKQEFLSIADFKQSKQQSKREPLFRTEDGKDIYEGDEYWWINTIHESDWYIYKRLATKVDGIELDTKTFSTYEAAKEYVVDNKSELSLNDIVFALNLLRDTHQHPFDKQQYDNVGFCLIEKLKQLVEQKINNSTL